MPLSESSGLFSFLPFPLGSLTTVFFHSRWVKQGLLGLVFSHRQGVWTTSASFLCTEASQWTDPRLWFIVWFSATQLPCLLFLIKTVLAGVAGSWTRLSDFTFTFHFHALEKEMATHSSVLVWRIPGTGEPGGLPSVGSHRVGHDWCDLAAAAAGILDLASLHFRWDIPRFLPTKVVYNVSFHKCIHSSNYLLHVWFVSRDWQIYKGRVFVYFINCCIPRASQVVLVVKNTPTNAGDIRDMGSIPGLGRSPGGGHGNPLQYCLENPMNRKAWRRRAIVHGVTKSQAWLSTHTWLSTQYLAESLAIAYT